MAATCENNRVRYTPSLERGHVESHFLKAVSPDATRAIWVKHTLLAPAAASTADLGVAEVWAIAFDKRDGRIVGAKSTYPIAHSAFSDAPFRIVTGGGEGRTVMENGLAQGRAESGGHRLHWDLRFEGSDARGYRPFPLDGMYRWRFPKTKSLTPFPDVSMQGEMGVNGETWAIEGWRGMQGHNWGRSHAHAYAWAHCNQFEGQDGVWFEGASARIEVAGRITPFLSFGALHIGETTYRFDGLRAITKSSVKVSETTYRATLRKGRTELRVDIAANAPDMAGLHYENPVGDMTYCLNSKLAEGRVRLMEDDHCLFDGQSPAFALEIGTKARDHGIAMVI